MGREAGAPMRGRGMPAASDVRRAAVLGVLALAALVEGSRGECDSLKKKACRTSSTCRWDGKSSSCDKAENACAAVQGRGKKVRKTCQSVSTTRCQCSKNPQKKNGKCGTCEESLLTPTPMPTLRSFKCWPLPDKSDDPTLNKAVTGGQYCSHGEDDTTENPPPSVPTASDCTGINIIYILGAYFDDARPGEGAEADFIIQLADYLKDSDSPSPGKGRKVMVMSGNGNSYYSDWMNRGLANNVTGCPDYCPEPASGSISWMRLNSWKSGSFQKCLQEAGPTLQAVVASSHGDVTSISAFHPMCAPDIDGLPKCFIPDGDTDVCDKFFGTENGCASTVLVYPQGASAPPAEQTCICVETWSAQQVAEELAKLPQTPYVFLDACETDAPESKDPNGWHYELAQKNIPWIGSSTDVQEGVGGDALLQEIMFMVLFGKRDSATAQRVKALNDAFQEVWKIIGGIGDYTFYPNLPP